MTQIAEPGLNQGTPFVLAVGNPSTNAFLVPNGEKLSELCDSLSLDSGM
jgi:hypothetical protein